MTRCGRALCEIRKRAKIDKVNSAGFCIIVTTANPLFSLDGRVALITGASRGLGLAMAEGLAEAGRRCHS